MWWSKERKLILLVDDEEMILDVGQNMLVRLGYKVVAAGGGSEALNKVKDLGEQIDLVILDLIMPEMDGEKTFQCIREVRPGMPVILSSGYSIKRQSPTSPSTGLQRVYSKAVYHFWTIQKNKKSTWSKKFLMCFLERMSVGVTPGQTLCSPL